MSTVFQPEWTDQPSLFSLVSSEGSFIPLIACACNYHAEIFEDVMDNLIRNPNITSSHLFRADILYDSENDTTYTPKLQFLEHEGSGKLEKSLSMRFAEKTSELTAFAKHMQADYRPRSVNVKGYNLVRTIVRRLVPRNPNLDKPLVQTCHLLQQEQSQSSAIRLEKKTCNSKSLVVYLPHVSAAEEVPFYHPCVKALGFMHCSGEREDAPSPSTTTTSLTDPLARISLHVLPFDTNPESYNQGGVFPERLRRTGLHLLKTLHKHGTGRLNGYQKQVHHDRMIPQARFQDTYTRLKGKYAKALMSNWCEQTDPVKHVFEDLGIAAFLIELWHDMYGNPGNRGHSGRQGSEFPGFVDIGCGNGILVSILLQEGFSGWGFDARRRKSWETFPASVQEKFREMTLVPSIIQSCSTSPLQIGNDTQIHDGVFPLGTFVISNHADELTLWTPLLAYISGGNPFLCIPCCSFDFTGARFRARMRAQNKLSKVVGMSKDNQMNGGTSKDEEHGHGNFTHASKAQPSAYASLCAYVEGITEDLGYTVQREMLRIPSTRNTAILGCCEQSKTSIDGSQTNETITNLEHSRQNVICKIIAKESNKDMDQICLEWSAQNLLQAKSSRINH